jgi:mannose-1-phosphate guanylyltransferase
MIPALVLTAGLATRLRPLSLVRAKAALPVAGEPLAGRILRWLASQGVADAVLNLHYLPHSITSQIGNGETAGLRVRYSWEVPILDRAGGAARAVPLLGSSTFLVVNGDTLADVSLAEVVDAHRRSGALVTMAVVPNTEPEKYSGVAAEDDGAVTGFVRRGSPKRSYHFVGIQVVEAEALASVPADTAMDTVGALYPRLLADRPGSIRVHASSAEFFDIGTPADYLETALLLGRREGMSVTLGVRSRIEPGARVDDSVLWDDVVVESGAMLRDCVVADGVRVPADTSWHGVTLRVATGELCPSERRVGSLAIAPL